MHSSAKLAPCEFDANRFIHWRYFWDYAGVQRIPESNSEPAAGSFLVPGAADLQIPRSATMSGGNYLWDDGRETPDTMDVSLDQPEQMLVSWSSGFGNNQLGMTEDLLGSHGTISRGNHGPVHAAEGQPARRCRAHGPRLAHAARAHGKFFRIHPLDGGRSPIVRLRSATASPSLA